EERDVEVRQRLSVGGRRILHRDLTVAEGEHLAGRAGRGEEADVADGEAPLEQDLPTRDTDLPGGSDDTDVDHANSPDGRAPRGVDCAGAERRRKEPRAVTLIVRSLRTPRPRSRPSRARTPRARR